MKSPSISPSKVVKKAHEDFFKLVKQREQILKWGRVSVFYLQDILKKYSNWFMLEIDRSVSQMNSATMEYILKPVLIKYDFDCRYPPVVTIAKAGFEEHGFTPANSMMLIQNIDGEMLFWPFKPGEK